MFLGVSYLGGRGYQKLGGWVKGEELMDGPSGLMLLGTVISPGYGTFPWQGVYPEPRKVYYGLAYPILARSILAISSKRGELGSHPEVVLL